MRTFVIGDIHGAKKALIQVLERSNINLNKDKLIMLGDYSDGWSETAELVQFIINMKKQMGDRLITILGNHDVWTYDYLHFGHTPYIWTEQGGRATIQSYIKTGYLVNQEHRDFFKNCVDWYIDDENRIFIHAGWDYKADIFPRSANYPVNAGTIAKECHWDRSLLQGVKSCTATYRGDKSAIFNGTQMFKEVYIGHTATKSHKIENYMNLWNMDSGCGWYGKLAIMNVDTKDAWYSDYSKELYPDEKGRQ